MRKKIFTFLLALVTSVGMSWATTTDLASITGDYTAQDGEILTGTLGVNVKISIADGATVTLLNANINGDKSWTTGEYAGLTCLGDATITIVGKNSVSGFSAENGYPGIYVPSGKTLIINGTGSLTAQSSTEEAAGIGAGRNMSCGNIEIQSGKITAIACGEEGAGIGGAFNGNCGNITINGGIVTAVGGYRGAGIGGGRRSGTTNAGHCGNILISGGVVSATSGEQAAAIGGGRGNNNNYKANCGTITITTALKVYADKGGGSGNTIGAGMYGTCGTVKIGDNTGVINNDPYTYRTKEDREIVVDYIGYIGTVVYTQECKDKIDIARELYDALEDSQKDLVTNYQTLLGAEAAYAALIPQPAPATPTVYNSGSVVLSNLNVGDILMAGVTVTSEKADYKITLAANRLKFMNSVRTSDLTTQFSSINPVLGENAVILTSTPAMFYTPIDEDGNTGNAWEVTANEVGTKVTLAGITYSGTTPATSDENITANEDPQHTGVYYSTFFDSANKYALPAGVEAYVAEVSSDALNLTKIAGEGQTFPADNAVILRSTVAGYTLTVSDAAPVTFTANNSLRGVDAETTVTDIAGLTANNCYVLSGGSEDETVTGVGFYLIYGTTLLAHKAYVQYSATSGAPRRMRFVFPQEQMPTGIDETNTADKAQKVMENGTLYIIRDGVRYNAVGQIAQ